MPFALVRRGSSATELHAYASEPRFLDNSLLRLPARRSVLGTGFSRSSDSHLGKLLWFTYGNDSPNYYGAEQRAGVLHSAYRLFVKHDCTIDGLEVCGAVYGFYGEWTELNRRCLPGIRFPGMVRPPLGDFLRFSRLA